jgi:hypothetical protein
MPLDSEYYLTSVSNKKNVDISEMPKIVPRAFGIRELPKEPLPDIVIYKS